jgi:hypothetical protein
VLTRSCRLARMTQSQKLLSRQARVIGRGYASGRDSLEIRAYSILCGYLRSLNFLSYVGYNSLDEFADFRSSLCFCARLLTASTVAQSRDNSITSHKVEIGGIAQTRYDHTPNTTQPRRDHQSSGIATLFLPNPASSDFDAVGRQSFSTARLLPASPIKCLDC